MKMIKWSKIHAQRSSRKRNHHSRTRNTQKKTSRNSGTDKRHDSSDLTHGVTASRRSDLQPTGTAKATTGETAPTRLSSRVLIRKVKWSEGTRETASRG